VKSQGLDPKDFLGEEALDKIAKQFKDCETGQDVLSRVGEGFISVQSFVQKLRGLNPQPVLPPDHVRVSTSKESKALVVSGSLEGLMIRRGRCCDPLPGEEVVGYVSRGKGIVIHRRMCNNAIAFETSEPERLTALEWPPTGEFFTAHVKIVTVNRQGLLSEITAVFADAKTNIVGANIRTHSNQTAEIEVSVDVTDIAHLNYLMTKVSNFSDVISVLRVYERATERRR
jgi:GTP pyrophosphokinase